MLIRSILGKIEDKKVEYTTPHSIHTHFVGNNPSFYPGILFLAGSVPKPLLLCV